MIEQILRKEIEWIAQSHQHKAHPQYIDPELANQRVSEYRPRIKLDYQCPACWVQHERRSNLGPIPTHTRDDALECDVCGASYLIPR